MPKGGARPGAGRPKGPGKAKREQAIIAEQIMARAEMRGEKLAKEVLNDFMKLFAGMAATAQPLPDGMAIPQGRKPDQEDFDKYARLAVETAAKLAPYQSPTFKAVAVSVQGIGDQVKTIDADNVIQLNDPIAAARVYRNMMTAGGGR